MNPSSIFILRPVATSLLMIALLLVGLIAYRKLPISALPQVDYPTIRVATLYPGASQDVMTSLVTAPLERQMGQLPGLKQMSSTSSNGASVITLQFDLNLNLDIAEQEVQSAINAAATFLPADLPMPPIYSKVNPADAPILSLSVSSDTLPLTRVEDLVETRLVQKLAQVSGVGLVSLSGGQRPAIRIQANPDALAGYGLGLEDLRAAIALANVNQPKGLIEGPLRSAIIDANDQIKSADEYRALVIAYKNGRPVHLADVAEVREDAENSRLAAWANGKAAVIISIQRQPGTNIIEVADRIRHLLPQLQQGLPADLAIDILADRTTTIRASVEAVQIELLLALALVVLIIYLFLRDLRATAIPAVVLPLSLIGTFAVMYLLGFSLNNLTLMALTIAAGFVVDDAIVVIENISRYLEQGEPPLKAAFKGSAQIAFTIISLTVSLIAVLIPLLFMADVVGRLFREFAVTLSVAIVISGLVSLSLTPMMCAYLLRPRRSGHRERDGRLMAFLVRIYGGLLRRVLRHQPATLGAALLTLALTALLYLIIPKGFFPVQDTGLIQGVAEAPESISFGAMAKVQQEVLERVLDDPAVAGAGAFIGIDGNNPTLNTGRLLINLKPPAERRESIEPVIRRLQAGFEQSDLSLYLQPVQDLTIESLVSRYQYQLTLEAGTAEELNRWTGSLVRRLAEQPEFTDVDSDLQTEGLQIFINIDRATASRLGVGIASIDNALYDAFGQRLVSTIFSQTNQYRVVLEVKPDYRRRVEDLQNLRVTSSDGAQVPLATLAEFSKRTAPLLTHHLEQFPAATISFNLAPDISLSDAVAVIEKSKQDIGLPLGIQADYQGTTAAFNASLSNTLWLILAAVVTVYIVLGILYESYIHPVTILSTLPSAAVGALAALLASNHDLDVIAVIGIILLLGIVKKNAILIIDFALDAQRGQKSAPENAIYQACLLRFRPIIMTTMAALLSALPLMLGTGVGSELRHPLGITMIGGLLVSQLLTLFTTPVIYLAFERLGVRFQTPAGPAGAEPEQNGSST